jgi:hypothetical protein
MDAADKDGSPGIASLNTRAVRAQASVLSVYG